jgi:hypothetical protein
MLTLGGEEQTQLSWRGQRGQERANGLNERKKYETPINVRISVTPLNSLRILKNTDFRDLVNLTFK